MQPPLRRLHSGSPLRYDLAGASLCATRASTSLRKGENAFSTPMKAKTQQDEDTGARRLLRGSQAGQIRRRATLRTAHKVRAPTRVPTSLRGGNTVLSPRQKTRKRKERQLWTDTQPDQSTFPNGQPC